MGNNRRLFFFTSKLGECIKTECIKTEWIKTEFIKTEWIKTEWIKTEWMIHWKQSFGNQSFLLTSKPTHIWQSAKRT